MIPYILLYIAHVILYRGLDICMGDMLSTMMFHLVSVLLSLLSTSLHKLVSMDTSAVYNIVVMVIEG